MRARILSALLGAVCVALGAYVAWANARQLTALSAGVAVGVLCFGCLLLDPDHVSRALAALVGIARQAKGAGAPVPGVAPAAPADAGESPAPGEPS